MAPPCALPPGISSVVCPLGSRGIRWSVGNRWVVSRDDGCVTIGSLGLQPLTVVTDREYHHTASRCHLDGPCQMDPALDFPPRRLRPGSVALASGPRLVARPSVARASRSSRQHIILAPCALQAQPAFASGACLPATPAHVVSLPGSVSAEMGSVLAKPRALGGSCFPLVGPPSSSP